MKIDVQMRPPVVVLTLTGRLDAFTSKSLEERIEMALRDGKIRHLILEVAGLEYLSSAGIRVLVTALKQLHNGGGDLALVGLKGYPEKVLDMSGFKDALPRYGSLGMALAATGMAEAMMADWEKATSYRGQAGTMQVAPWSRDECEVRVLGSIKDVLHCRVTPELMRSKRFSATEHSLGLGGLGDKLEDYFPILGEMITIGGTMVWLPTDGHDTADYLIPQKDTGEVTIRTAFNVSLAGSFNDLVMFKSNGPEGAQLVDIYRDLFAFAREHRPDYKGGLGVVMRAEVKAAFGAGVLRAPILANQPDNQMLLTDPENFEAWFEVDHAPRHRDVTALITGIGLDLRSAHGQHYDQELTDSAFYVNPGNRPRSEDEILHNHGVYFSALPFSTAPRSLEEEIAAVVENGDFRDMRHVFDNTRITRALIGVGYVDQFVADKAD